MKKRIMHWEELPKTNRHEEATREYERKESQRIAVFLKRSAWILPVVILILWLLRE